MIELVRDAFRDMGVSQVGLVPLDEADLRGKWFLLFANGGWYAAPSEDWRIAMEKLT